MAGACPNMERCSTLWSPAQSPATLSGATLLRSRPGAWIRPRLQTSHRPQLCMNRLPALPLHLAQSLAAYPALLWLHEEPSNALSLPTWAIHVSSVAEWAVAMALIRRMADVTKNPAWTGLSWGMVPSLGSAMCAVTW
ncbi:CGLD32 [Auxenochlorella protothecoides x Auxenochlorella symbiontica]